MFITLKVIFKRNLKGIQKIGHIIQTVLSGECNSKCINSIVSSDLKYATYSQAMYVLDQVSKKLPNVFKGVKRELSIKIEEKYKKSVLK